MNRIDLTQNVKLEKCIEDIRSWLTQNLLKLNENKTDLVIITSPHFANNIKNSNIQVGEVLVSPNDYKTWGSYLTSSYICKITSTPSVYLHTTISRTYIILSHLYHWQLSKLKSFHHIWTGLLQLIVVWPS